MPTGKFYVNNNIIELDGFAPLCDSDLAVVKRHVELTDHLMEIRELFSLFIYNLESIHDNYLLMSNGNITKNGKSADTYEDYIAVNALVINMISSARTLVESMEIFANNYKISEGDFSNKYLSYYHETYDNSFSYRLFIRLRDYSQHGHLPVARKAENYAIELYPILHTRHFRHNKAIGDEIDRLIEEIIEKYADTPTLSITITISEFTVSVLSIYQKFWSLVSPIIKTSVCRCNTIVSKNETNIEKDLFFYEIVKGNAHCIPIKNDYLKMYEDNLTKANEVLAKYRSADEKLKSGMMKICISDDKKQIEVDHV